MVQEPKLFISYAHEDQVWLQKLLDELEYDRKRKGLSLWSDKNIVPGALWFNEIQKAIAEATVVVLLPSRDFLASDFIYEYELRPILERARAGTITLISVVVRPCSFADTDLVHYQSFVQPLSQMSVAKQEAQLTVIGQAIKKALSIQSST